MMLRPMILPFFAFLTGLGNVCGQNIAPVDLQQQIGDAYKGGKKQVVIPPGEYHLVCPEAQTWHLQLRNMKNFTIEATGATFIFDTRDKRGILFENCDNVTFHGATLLRPVPNSSQGEIKAIAANLKAVDILVHDGYPTDIDNPRYFFKTPVLTIFTPGGRLKKDVPDVYIKGIERLSANLFRFHLRDGLKPQIPVAVGDQAAWRGSAPGKVAGHDVDLRYCKDFKFSGITMKNAFGIAVFESCGEGNNYYNYTITYGPLPPGATQKPLLSSGADGFHSAAVRKGPTLENCLFEGIHDDGVNIHGQFAMALEAQHNKVILDYRGSMVIDGKRNPFGQPGDTIQFYDGQCRLIQEAKLIKYEEITDYREPAGQLTIDSRVFNDRTTARYSCLTLDRDVPVRYGWFVANANEIGNGFLIKNCINREHRAHGIFLRAGGVVENCVVENIHMGGIVVAPEFGSWNEASYVQNLVLRNNVIRRTGIATQPWNCGVTVANFEGHFTPSPGGHRNIVIEDNTFEDNDGPNIIVSSAAGVKIRNNRFVRPMKEPMHCLVPAVKDSGLIYLTDCEQVEWSGNRIIEPGAYLKQRILATPTAIGVGGDIP